MTERTFHERKAGRRDTILYAVAIVALVIAAGSLVYGVSSGSLVLARLTGMTNHLSEVTITLERIQERQSQISREATISFSRSQERQSQINSDQELLAARINASIEAADIRAQLSDELTAGTALEDWRSLAVGSGYARIESLDPKTYKLTDQGHTLLDYLDPGLFIRLSDSAEPYLTTVARLRSIPLTAFVMQLAKYNIEYDTFVRLQTVLGVLAAFLYP